MHSPSACALHNLERYCIILVHTNHFIERYTKPSRLGMALRYGLLVVVTLMGLQYTRGQLHSRPCISKAFYSEYRLIQEGTVISAVAYHDRDAGRDRTVHNMGTNGQEGKVNYLIRLDQKAAYQYYEPYNYCSITKRGNITIPNFDWVQYSSYKKSTYFYGHKVQVWVYRDTYLYNEIGVMATNRNTPVYYFRANGKEGSFLLTIFDAFVAGPQDDSNFDIPLSCRCREQSVDHEAASIKEKSVIRTEKDIQQTIGAHCSERLML